jgi:hypothetical protein
LKYANDGISKIKEVWSSRHDYLATTLNFTIPGVLQVDMTQYVKKMIQKFPKKLSGKSRCPWSKNLYKVDKKSPKLSEEKSKIFHTFVMKGIFPCKHARQDVLPDIVFLATRVKDSNQQDNIKLVNILNYLKVMENEISKMSANKSQTIKWYIDSLFMVHKDMRGHTRVIMTLRKGAIISESTKQKVNARSSTESKMITVNNTISKLL